MQNHHSSITKPSHLRFFILLFSFLSIGQLRAQISSPEDTTKKITFAATPIVNYSNTFGFMAGAMGSAYYKLNPEDTISPSSSTLLMGIYSTSNTFMALAVEQIYFDEDNWRAKFAIGGGEIFFQTFQDLPSSGEGYWSEEGIWIEYNTSMVFLWANLQRQTISNLYIGIESMLSKSITEFDIDNPISDEKPKIDANMNSIGYNLLYDNRDDVNYPTKGYFIQYKNNFVREWLGSSDNFDQIELSFNHFWDINKNSNSILVPRFYSKIAIGDVPFQGQNVVSQDDLRGYSKGKFRGDQVYAVQVELRQKIYKKFGMIGFLGIGAAIDDFNEINNTEALPSIGGGLRYLMIPKEKINIGVDFGVGKDDWSLTFRIGETFGR